MNHPPVINTTLPAQLAVGESLIIPIQVTDPDPEDQERLALSMRETANTSAEFDAVKRIFRWTPRTAWPDGAVFIFTATDARGATTSRPMMVTVTRKNQTPNTQPTLPTQNHAPILPSIPPLTAVVGEQLGFTVHATDPEQNPLTYTAAPLPRGSAFDRTSGLFLWTPTASQAGKTYQMTFGASDGGLTMNQQAAIAVLMVNPAPPALPASPVGGTLTTPTPATPGPHYGTMFRRGQLIVKLKDPAAEPILLAQASQPSAGAAASATDTTSLAQLNATYKVRGVRRTARLRKDFEQMRQLRQAKQPLAAQHRTDRAQQQAQVKQQHRADRQTRQIARQAPRASKTSRRNGRRTSKSVKSGASDATPATAPEKTPTAEPDETVDDTSGPDTSAPEQADSAAVSVEAQQAGTSDPNQTYVVDVPPETDIKKACDQYAADPNVEYAQPNYVIQTTSEPNDPYYKSSGSWGQPFDDLWALKKIQASKAWDVTQGDGIVVAVVDSGLDATHPDIAGNLWTNPKEIPGNGIDDDGNGYIDDVYGWDLANNDNVLTDNIGHGTHVAGTIAAIGNNGLGIVGVAPKVKIMPVKVFDIDGKGDSATAAEAIKYAAMNGADVINNSWGCSQPCASNPIVEDAVRFAHSLGAVVIFSAGNNADAIGSYSPQNMPETITVAATTPDDTPAWFSNHSGFGIATLYDAATGQYISKLVSGTVDVAAPGGGLSGNTGNASSSVDVHSLMAEWSGDPDLMIALFSQATGDAPPTPNGGTPLPLLKTPLPTTNLGPFQMGFQTLGLGTAPVTGGANLQLLSNESRNILSLRAKNTCTNPTACDPNLIVGSDYIRLSGTSMAAPHVSGLAALILAHHSTFSNEDVRQVLRVSADDISTPGVDLATGAGRINAANALAVDAVPQFQVTSPAPSDTFSQLTGTVTVTGSVTGNEAKSYTLAYGQGLAPSTWTPIATQPAPTTQDTLGRWLIRPLANGLYTLSLAIDTASHRVFREFVPVVIQQRPPQQITTDQAIQSAPAISGHRIVWMDRRKGQYDIYLYDLDTKTEHQLTTYSAPQIRPAISGNRVVWMDLRRNRNDLYMCTYDPSSGTCPEQQITNDLVDQLYPDIDGDWIVWSDQRTGSSEIYAYNVVTQEQRPLTSESTDEEAPKISGTRVVWQGLNQDHYDIYLYDFATQTTQQITKDSSQHLHPSISGKKIVWTDNRNGNYDIYLYDLDTKQETRLTNDAGDQVAPTISGDRVVWQDQRNGHFQVYLMDLTTQQQWLLAFYPTADQHEPAIDGNLIVWQDNRNDTGTGNGPVNGDIYLYDFAPTPAGPTIDPIGPQTAREGMALTFAVSASGFSGPGATLTAAPLPTGAHFDPVTSANPSRLAQPFTWTPGFDQAGTYAITFTATDPSGTRDAQTVTVTVANVDRPPVVTVVDHQTARVGEPLTFTIAATDPDQDPLTYTMTGAPNGAALDTMSGVFSWTPTKLQSGKSYPVMFTVSDGTLTATQTVTIAVETSNNHPPIFSPIIPQTIKPGHLLTLAVSATDTDGDALTYAADPLPEGAAFDNATLTWTPKLGQEGTYPITFTADDGLDQSTQTVTITVVNRPPTLDPITPQTVKAGKMLSFTLKATDPDQDPLTFTMTGAPSNATLDSVTGMFNWSPALAEDGKSYTVIFTADDGAATAQQTATITVANQKPVLTALPATVNASVGTPFTLTLVATDVDGDTLTYTATGAPDGGTLKNNVFSWTPTPAQARTSSAVTFTVTDGQADDRQTTTIAVVNRSPVFAPIPDQPTKLNQPLTLNLASFASDPDGDLLTYEITNAPPDVQAAIDPNTGVVTSTPTNKSVAQYTMEFIANDGAAQTKQSVRILVDVGVAVGVNKPPTLNTITGVPASIKIGELLDFSVIGTDPDGDQLTYQIMGRPSRAIFVQTTGVKMTTGHFSWTPIAGEEGPYTMTFTARDKESSSNLQTVTVTVATGVTSSGPTISFSQAFATADLYLNPTPNNPAPNKIGIYIIPNSNASLEMGYPAYTYDFIATSSTNAGITYSIPNNTNPAIHMDPSGRLTFTVAQEGQYVFTVRAATSDGQLLKDVTVIITVHKQGTTIEKTSTDQKVDKNRPVLQPIVVPGLVNGWAEVNQPITFTLSANDLDRDPLTYYLTGDKPADASLDSTTGIFRWTPGSNDAGKNYTLTFTVSDGTLTHSQAASIKVSNPRSITGNTPPVLHKAIASPPPTMATTPIDLVIDGTDKEDDENHIPLTYSYAAQPQLLGGNPQIVSQPGQPAHFLWTPPPSNTTQHYDITFTVEDSGDEIGDQHMDTRQTVTIIVTPSEESPNAGETDQTGSVSLRLPIIRHPDLVATGQLLKFPVPLAVTSRGLNAKTLQYTVDPKLVNKAALANADDPAHATAEGQLNTGDPAHMTYMWTPGEENVGTYQLTFSVTYTDEVTKEVTTDQRTVEIKVVKTANHPPHLPQINPNQTVYVGEKLKFVVSTATDEDRNDPNNILVYSAEGVPSGATFNGSGAFMANIGLEKLGFVWTPTKGQEGLHQVTFRVRDREKLDDPDILEDHQTVTIKVQESSNQPPRFPVIPKLLPVVVGTPITIQVPDAYDPDGSPDGAPLRYYILDKTNPDSERARFDVKDNSRTFRWTPTQPGDYSVTFVADDGDQRDLQTVTIVVKAQPNSPPRLPYVEPQFVRPGHTLSFKIPEAVDKDEGDQLKLVYTVEGQPMSMGAAFDGASRLFTWATTNDQAGTYPMTITVRDRSDPNDPEVLTDHQMTTISVGDAKPSGTNQPPVIRTIIPAQMVRVGHLVTFRVDGWDANSDPLTYTAKMYTDNMAEEPWPTEATLNPKTGYFSWTPTTTQQGAHTVVFTVSDGTLSDSQQTTITVVSDANRPPVMDRLQSWNARVKELITFTVSARDPDPEDQLTYSAKVTVAKDDQHFKQFESCLTSDDQQKSCFKPDDTNPLKRKFNWTPTSSDDEGIYKIDFTADDGRTGTVTQTVTITVVAAENKPPVLAHLDNWNKVTPGQPIKFRVSATDPDTALNVLTYNIEPLPLPTGVAFDTDSDSRVFTWIPTKEQEGTYTFLFSVSDGEWEDTQQVTITIVKAANRPPLLDLVPALEVIEGHHLSYQLMGRDQDKDPITYTAGLKGLPDEQLPPGATFGKNTGLFTWTPTHDDRLRQSRYTLVFTVTDGQGTAFQEGTITVTPKTMVANRSPVIASVPAQKVQAGGTPLTFTLSAKDLDGDHFTFLMDNAPAGATLDAITWLFSWAPTPDQKLGDYTITFRVREVRTDDLTPEEDKTTVTITVVAAESNRPPVVTPLLPQTTVNSGETLQFTVTATDPDDPRGAHLTYTAEGLPPGASWNSTKGTFSWSPTDRQIDQEYPLTITVSDGLLSDNTTTTIKVLRPKKPNQPPVFSPIASQTVQVGQTLIFRVSATDPENDPLSYGVSDGAPSTASMSKDGEFRWSPRPDQADKSYTVTFVVSDGQFKDYKATTVTAAKATSEQPAKQNHMPSLRTRSFPSQKTITVGDTVSFTVKADDADATDVLAFSLGTDAPSGAQINPTSGDFSWTPTTSQIGVYPFTVIVSDGNGGLDRQTITITVKDANHPPKLKWLPPHPTRKTGETVEFSVGATDQDKDDILTYAVSPLPTGASLQNGTFTWTPTSAQVGTYQLTVSATDSHGAADQQIVPVTVEDANHAPQLKTSSLPTQRKVNVGDPVTFTAKAKDKDGNTLTFTASPLPSGATFVGGTFTWTPTAAQAGDYKIIVTVSDGKLQDSAPATITVAKPANTPTTTPPPTGPAGSGKNTAPAPTPSTSGASSSGPVVGSGKNSTGK